MDVQLVLTMIAIAVAGAYVAWRGWRVTRVAKGGCSGGCGCAKTPTMATTLIAPDQLVLRK